MSIWFSGKLPEYMRRFPSLYDKTNKLCKDKNVNRNARPKAAEELFLETGMLLKLS